MFDTAVNIFAISNENIFKYKFIKGRNISDEEIKNGSKVAVISKNYESFCKKENNKLYIDIDNNTYEVVGIIGNRYSSSYFNLMIFIPYTSTPQIWKNDNTILNCNFLVSGKDISIENYKKDFYIKETKFSSLPNQTISNNLFVIKQDVIYFCIISIISIVNIIIFSFYWINKKKTQIGILKAIGYSKNSTTALVRNELFILSIISSICASSLYYPFSNFFNKYFFDIGLNGSPIILGFDFLFSFICSLIVVIFNKKKIDQLSISNNIADSINFSKKLWVKIILVIQISLVLNYSVVAFDTINYVFSTLNKAKKIINIENVEIVDPFTVSYDEKDILEYDIQKTLGKLKNQDLILINYLYSIDSSRDVTSMKNRDKNNYDPNYSDNYFRRVRSGNVIPIVYIEKDSFKGLKLKINEYKTINDNDGSIPVYAGHDYKKYFLIGDIIKGDSGQNYKIAGFLEKNCYMFNENISSESLSQTNNLNSFIIIPYSIYNIKNLPLGYTKNDFIHYSMTNSFFVFKSPNVKKVIHSTLNSKGIQTSLLNKQLERFTQLNFNYVSYKLFNIIMIFLICIGGLIAFSISCVFSEKRDIGIKMALGFNKTVIIEEYIFKIVKLLAFSFLIIIIRYFILPDIKLTIKLLAYVLSLAIIIPIPSIILIFYFINRYVPSELIGGEK